MRSSTTLESIDRIKPDDVFNRLFLLRVVVTRGQTVIDSVYLNWRGVSDKYQWRTCGTRSIPLVLWSIPLLMRSIPLVSRFPGSESEFPCWPKRKTKNKKIISRSILMEVSEEWSDRYSTSEYMYILNNRHLSSRTLLLQEDDVAIVCLVIKCQWRRVSDIVSPLCQ